jgi:hypothetical protein
MIIYTYRSIDIRAVLAKSKAESIWYSVVLKVRLTKDSRTELKQTQETKQSKLGTLKREKFRVVFENKDVQQLEFVLSEIKNGCVTLNGDRTKLVGADFQNIFQKDIVNDQLYTTTNQRSGNTHKMVFTAMPESFTRNILQVSLGLVPRCFSRASTTTSLYRFVSCAPNYGCQFIEWKNH